MAGSSDYSAGEQQYSVNEFHHLRRATIAERYDSPCSDDVPVAPIAAQMDVWHGVWWRMFPCRESLRVKKTGTG